MTALVVHPDRSRARSPRLGRENRMMHDDRAASARRPAWGAALARFSSGWQRLESWLCVTVLVAEIAALASWVVLRGLSTDSAYGDRSGLACRSLLAVACL